MLSHANKNSTYQPVHLSSLTSAFVILSIQHILRDFRNAPLIFDLKIYTSIINSNRHFLVHVNVAWSFVGTLIKNLMKLLK